MSDEGVPAPDAGESAPVGPDSGSAAGSDVSTDAGNAPGAGSDAPVTDPAAGQVPPAPVAEFLFGNRKFRDQKHAEEIVGSEVGRTRTLQRQQAEAQRQLAVAQGELQALRGLIPQGPGNGQGPGAGGAPSGPKSFAESLAKDNTLNLFGKLMKDPDQGPEKAAFLLADAFDKKLKEELGKVESEVIGPMSRRHEGSQHMARALGVATRMAADMPEIADYGDDTTEEIEAAQAEILRDLQRSPELLRQDPERALWNAVMWYRERHGTPVMAPQPGTSGSPSSLAAAAAEAAGAASASTPLDGSGVPRQGGNGKPANPLAAQWRKDSSLLPKEAKTPSGRSLGFEESS